MAVLLLTNFGERKRLTVDGVTTSGACCPRTPDPQRPAGSCIGVVVTDAPVISADCARLARRIGLGLARTGSTAHNGSGEIFLGVSSTRRAPATSPGRRAPWSPAAGLDDLFEAVVDAAEEAVLNSLLMAPTTTGRDGNISEGLDPATVVQLMGEHARGN